MAGATLGFAQTACSMPPRQLLPLSGDSWQFFGIGKTDSLPAIDSPEFESGPWQDVSVPHVFQTRTDISLEQGWYRRQLMVPTSFVGKRLYLVFEGAAAIADVYVNGVHLGQHRGAYTRFIFDATAALHPGADNELAVEIDNRAQSTRDCLPDGRRLYMIWGGLYRPAWLLATNDLQIDPTYFASPGIFITPTEVSAASASLEIKILLRNASSANLAPRVTATVIDPKGREIQTLSGVATVPAHQGPVAITLAGTVPHPLLWEPGAPHLYHVRVDVFDRGALTDSLTQPLGFRSTAWDFRQGKLQLNGKPIVLYGADLHQETEKKASALAPEDFVENFDALQDLGVNFLRLPHYPHAAIEYNLCDQRGILCWAENGHTNNDLAGPTADQITTEMVEQNYNHPSIIIWSVGNEASANVADREVPVVRALDSTRAVMVANMKSALADYRATNTYPGWYGGDRWKFSPKGLITEVGAGGVVTTHCDYAAPSHKVDGYEPEEYQQLVAETELERAFRHNQGKLGMFTWWTFREFDDMKYKSAGAPFRNGVNSKGLETYAGDKKDVFYLYRSFLRPNTPTLHIASQRYFLRQGAADNGIKVYSNAAGVALRLNGKTVSRLSNGQYHQPPDPHDKTGESEIDNVFFWKVPLQTGRNTVAVSDDKGNRDAAVIYFYGPNGLPETPDGDPVIRDLASSNPVNPAYYMNMPVHAQWPIYYDLDSTADNSLDLIPDAIQGATWLALHRVTKPGEATDVSFTMARPATVYVLSTRTNNPASFLTENGFNAVEAGPILWRGNDLILTPAELYARKARAGESLKISLGDRDALILFQAH